MQLHELKSKHPRKRRTPRVGRGGKRGSYSGKGVKGQRARSGHRILPAIREYIQRLPKRRGFRNLPKSEKKTIVNLGDLERITQETTITPKLWPGKQVKILGDGEVKKPYTIEGVEVSKSAKVKIEKAGGKVS